MLENGAEFKYIAGQPVMTTGVHNAAVLSLFTRGGWNGNVFLPPESRLGSDFEEICCGTLTLSKLADVENSAVRALTSKLFPQVTATARNPSNERLSVEIKIGAGGALNLNREGPLWQAQARNLEVQ
jgi:hypothetical protein